MFGRIFGRGKDDQDQAVCAQCGRTLLAGEWTQTIVDEHGDERLICSLCGQAYAGENEPVAAAPAPANNGRVRETRSEARSTRSGRCPSPSRPPSLNRHATTAPRATPSGRRSRRRTPRSNSSRPSWRARRPSGRSSPAGSRASARPAQPPAKRRSPARSPATRPSRASAPGARPRPSSPPRWPRCVPPRPARRRPQEVWDEPAPEPALEAAPAAEEEVVEAAVVEAARRRGERRRWRAGGRGGRGRGGRGRRECVPRGRRRGAGGRLADRVRRHAAHRRHLRRDARGRGPEHRRDRRGRGRGGGRRRRWRPAGRAAARAAQSRPSRPPRRRPRQRPRPRRSRSCSAASTCST